MINRVTQAPTFNNLFSSDPWERLSASFEEYRIILTTYLLEEREDAIKKKALLANNLIYDDDLKIHHKHHMIIPYRASDDFEMLRMHYNNAKLAIQQIEKCIQDKTLTVEFLLQWGAFSSSMGYLESAIYAVKSDASEELRSQNQLGSKTCKPQQKFAAMQFLKFMQNGKKRNEAERYLAEHIHQVILLLDSEEDKRWLKVMLHENGQLKSTYFTNKIGNKDLEYFANLSDVIVPEKIISLF